MVALVAAFAGLALAFRRWRGGGAAHASRRRSCAGRACPGPGGRGERDRATAPMPATDHSTDARSPTPAGRRRLDPDALAALEDQRDFLLRSLDDLERERAAGDVDERDYETLKDDYTARAARTIRAIDSHQARRSASARQPRSWRRSLARWPPASRRSPCWRVCWSPRPRAGERRATRSPATSGSRPGRSWSRRAAWREQQRYDEALEIYDEVLAEQPDNAEALAYRAGPSTSPGDASGAADTLTAALEADPELRRHVRVPRHHPQPGRPARRGAGRARPVRGPRPASRALDLVAGLRERLERQVPTAGHDGDDRPGSRDVSRPDARAVNRDQRRRLPGHVGGGM